MPFISGACARAAFTSVPLWWPKDGCTTMPAGLFTTMRLFVLENDIQRNIFSRHMAGLDFWQIDFHSASHTRASGPIYARFFH